MVTRDWLPAGFAVATWEKCLGQPVGPVRLARRSSFWPRKCKVLLFHRFTSGLRPKWLVLDQFSAQVGGGLPWRMS